MVGYVMITWYFVPSVAQKEIRKSMNISRSYWYD